jgi:cholesterol oxidase
MMVRSMKGGPMSRTFRDGASKSGDTAPTAPELRFSERMAGFASTAVTDDYRAGWARGKIEGGRLEHQLTIVAEDLPAVLADPATPARLSGVFIAPQLSSRPLDVVGGEFRLLVPDPDHVETWSMRYSLDLLSEEGRRYRLEGYKVLRERPGLNAWRDTTTLYVTIWNQNGTKVCVGIMRVTPMAFLKLLSTIRVLGIRGLRRRIAYALSFLGVFARSLLHIYGGPLDEPGRFPAAPSSPVLLAHAAGRPPRLPQAEVYWCDGAKQWQVGPDVGADAWLRLIRYRGDSKGPVVLAPGFGMSATSFAVTTIETNLVEYLVEHGYDVWLFDYRASIDLPSARTPFTLDDIATKDWPTAVEEVRRRSGAETVQAVGHCVGSATLLMALLAGMEGVRSAVCSQFTTHPVTSPFNLLKATLGVGRVLQLAGIRYVSPDVQRRWTNYLLDLALRAAPAPRDERCGQAVCRWITAIYGCTHRHAQLNEATHKALNLMFGVGQLDAFDQIALIMRRQRAVDRRGADVYVSHPERLAIPIHFIIGERNYIFRPAGSERTLRWLREHNDPSLYSSSELEDYAHLDGLIGRSAAQDVYPSIAAHLDRNAAARPGGPARAQLA